MSFTPLMTKLVASLLDELPSGPSVIELGNQTFDPTISGSLTAPEDQMLPLVYDYLQKRGKPFDQARFQELMRMTHEEQRPHTGNYYQALGFSSYDAIDVNSKYGSKIMDLNVSLRDEYKFTETYDLVTNNGTGEHIFNQYMVFKNSHELTKTGGIQLFVLPFYNWMNHGFFNFNPLMFTDLAGANGYELVRLSVACPVGQEVTAGNPKVSDRAMRLSWQPETAALSIEDFQNRGAISPRTPRNTASKLVRRLTGREVGRQGNQLPYIVEKLAERVSNINVVAALRKTRDAPFVTPIQGMYSGLNIESEGLRSSYTASD